MSKLNSVKKIIINPIRKIIFEFSYVIYRLFLYLIPKIFYRHIIRVYTNLIRFTERVYYNGSKIKKINIENVNFYLYCGQVYCFDYAKMAKKVAPREWGKKWIYEYTLIKILQNLLQFEKKPLFMDIGSFQGYYALYVSKYLEDKIPVYAIESNKQYCSDIKKSIKLNNFSNCKLIDAVLADKEKNMLIDKDTVSHALKNEGKNISVAKTLDSVVKELDLSPNILKIDVHASEGPLLIGAEETLKNSVNFLLLELHTAVTLKKFSPGYSRKIIINNLIDIGFDCYGIAPFRTLNTDEGEIFLKTNKIKYIKIEKPDIEKIFFDHSYGFLVLGIKKGLDISKLDCFVHDSE